MDSSDRSTPQFEPVLLPQVLRESRDLLALTNFGAQARTQRPVPTQVVVTTANPHPGLYRSLEFVKCNFQSQREWTMAAANQSRRTGRLTEFLEVTPHQVYGPLGTAKQV